MGKRRDYSSGGGQGQGKKARSSASAEVGNGGGPQSAEALKRQLRIKHLSQQLKKAEEEDEDGEGALLSTTQKLRAQLADALIESGNHLRAAAVLKHHGLCGSGKAGDGRADVHLARHRLAPLLLRLGKPHDAEALLARCGADPSTTIRASHLVCSLTGWMAGAHSRASEKALHAVLRANASLAWLLAAPQTRRVRCSRKVVPPGLLEDMVELRSQLQARCEVERSGPSRQPLATGAADATGAGGGAVAASGGARPAPGGVEEALLLILGEFEGWAIKRSEDAWDGCVVKTPGAADEVMHAADGEEEEDLEPQLDLLCALLMRQAKKTGASMPQAAACARKGDSAKAIAFMDTLLEPCVAEVQARVKKVGEAFGEEALE